MNIIITRLGLYWMNNSGIVSFLLLTLVAYCAGLGLHTDAPTNITTKVCLQSCVCSNGDYAICKGTYKDDIPIPEQITTLELSEMTMDQLGGYLQKAYHVKHLIINGISKINGSTPIEATSLSSLDNLQSMIVTDNYLNHDALDRLFKLYPQLEYTYLDTEALNCGCSSLEYFSKLKNILRNPFKIMKAMSCIRNHHELLRHSFTELKQLCVYQGRLTNTLYSTLPKSDVDNWEVDNQGKSTAIELIIADVNHRKKRQVFLDDIDAELNTRDKNLKSAIKKRDSRAPKSERKKKKTNKKRKRKQKYERKKQNKRKKNEKRKNKRGKKQKKRRQKKIKKNKGSTGLKKKMNEPNRKKEKTDTDVILKPGNSMAADVQKDVVKDTALGKNKMKKKKTKNSKSKKGKKNRGKKRKNNRRKKPKKNRRKKPKNKGKERKKSKGKKKNKEVKVAATDAGEATKADGQTDVAKDNTALEKNEIKGKNKIKKNPGNKQKKNRGKKRKNMGKKQKNKGKKRKSKGKRRKDRGKKRKNNGKKRKIKSKKPKKNRGKKPKKNRGKKPKNKGKNVKQSVITSADKTAMEEGNGPAKVQDSVIGPEKIKTEVVSETTNQMPSKQNRKKQNKTEMEEGNGPAKVQDSVIGSEKIKTEVVSENTNQMPSKQNRKKQIKKNRKKQKENKRKQKKNKRKQKKNKRKKQKNKGKKRNKLIQKKKNKANGNVAKTGIEKNKGNEASAMVKADNAEGADTQKTLEVKTNNKRKQRKKKVKGKKTKKGRKQNKRRKKKKGRKQKKKKGRKQKKNKGRKQKKNKGRKQRKKKGRKQKIQPMTENISISQTNMNNGETKQPDNILSQAKNEIETVPVNGQSKGIDKNENKPTEIQVTEKPSVDLGKNEPTEIQETEAPPVDVGRNELPPQEENKIETVSDDGLSNKQEENKNKPTEIQKMEEPQVDVGRNELPPQEENKIETQEEENENKPTGIQETEEPSVDQLPKDSETNRMLETDTSILTGLQEQATDNIESTTKQPFIDTAAGEETSLVALESKTDKEQSSDVNGETAETVNPESENAAPIADEDQVVISKEMFEQMKEILSSSKIDLPVDINDPYDLGLLLRHLRHHSDLLANIENPAVKQRVLNALNEQPEGANEVSTKNSTQQ